MLEDKIMQMKNKTMGKRSNKRILAIDPGTKNIGFALLDNGELIHFGVKSVPQMMPSCEILKRGKRIIVRLIDDFRPNFLAVEKTYFANNKDTVLLNTFTKVIQKIGKRKGLMVSCIAINTVRKVICGNGAASKDDVARVIVSKYVELKPYLTSNRKWKERYFQNMFDAIAITEYITYHNNIKVVPLLDRKSQD
jgi:Holliday junction resolvasome RuvABC endonuclease subunit